MTASGHPAAPAAGAVPFRPGLLELSPDGGGHLVGSRCGGCGATFFPPRRVCSRCLDDALEPTALSTFGTVHSCTVVHQAAPGFEVPYALAYVDLPEGVRVLGQVEGVAPEEVRIGAAVELELAPVGSDAEGRELVGYRWRATP